MKSIAIWAVVAAVSLGYVSAGSAQRGAQVPVDIVTSGFALKFLPDRAWTFGRIDYAGETLVDETGFNGTTLATGPALFIGTGHKEGGVEVVNAVEISIDGKEVEASTLAGTVQCNTAKITKHSQIGTFSHLAEWEIQSDRINFVSNLTSEETSFVELIYPLMFCWTAETTEWMAELKSGEIVSGKFSSNEGWQLEKDARWTAIYSPKSGIAAVLIFAADFPDGKIHKHGFWDRANYHKQYFQSSWREEFGAGEKVQCRGSLIPVKASEGEWKETVQAAVTRFQSEP